MCLGSNPDSFPDFTNGLKAVWFSAKLCSARTSRGAKQSAWTWEWLPFVHCRLVTFRLSRSRLRKISQKYFKCRGFCCFSWLTRSSASCSLPWRQKVLWRPEPRKRVTWTQRERLHVKLLELKSKRSKIGCKCLYSFSWLRCWSWCFGAS